MANRFVRLLVVCLAVGLLALPLAAQEVTRGTIQVTVEDSTGAVVQGAKVTITNPILTRTLNTDSTGVATFLALTPGKYDVRAEMQGFKTAEGKAIEVYLNQRTSVKLTLEPGAVTQVIEVTGAATALDTATASYGGSVSDTLRTRIPVGLGLTSLFYLAPGVSDGGGSGTQNPSMGGASGLENLYVIDGVNVTNPAFGAIGVYSASFGPLGSGVTTAFIKEVQIKTGALEAQYSGGVGGLVNVVTKSGGNAFHGAIYVHSTPNALQAEQQQVNPRRSSSLLTETLNRANLDFGAEVGGYFWKDKVFFFGAINPTITNILSRPPFRALTGLVPANTAACQREFNFRPLPGDSALCPFPLSLLGNHSVHTHTTNYAAKLTWNVHSGHVIEASMFGDPSVRSRSPVSFRGDASQLSQLQYGQLNYTIRYNGAITPTWLLNGNWNYNHNRVIESGFANNFQVIDQTGPVRVTTGRGFFENDTGGNKGFDVNSSKQFKFWGSHQWDVGFTYQRTNHNALRRVSGPDTAYPDDTVTRARNLAGVISYGLQFRLLNCATAGCRAISPSGVYFRQVRGNAFPLNGTIATKQDFFGAYTQDSWQFNKYLTFKFGLRWEEENMFGDPSVGIRGPLGSHYAFTGSWGPRFGILVDPFGKRRTKVYFNFGRYFERIPQDLAQRSLSVESGFINLLYRADADRLPRPDQAHYIAQALITGTGNFPGEAGGRVSGGAPTTVFPGTKQSFQDEYVVGIEHEFRGGIVVGGRYIDRRLKRIVEDLQPYTVEQYLAGGDAFAGYTLSNVSATSDIFRSFSCINPGELASGENPCPGGFADGSGELLVGGDGIPDGFPNAVRDYQAVEITVEKRFSKNWQLMANWRISRLRGNFEGFFRNDNGQDDPAISSLFDFAASPALGAQFIPGPLNTDRTHVVNFYGSYMLDHGLLNNLNIGWGARFTSGTPLNIMAAHPAYENGGEMPIGRRGINGRSPVTGTVDLHLDYPIKITERFKLRAAIDLFNIFNASRALSIDQFSEQGFGVPNPDGPLDLGATFVGGAPRNPEGRGVGTPGDPWVTGDGFQRPFSARWSLRFEF